MAAHAILGQLGLEDGDIVFLGNVAVRENDEIGRGSDAVLYRIEWQGIKVALKVLHSVLTEPGNDGRDKKIQQFGKEISKLSKLTHPNLCQMIGVAQVGYSPALALELLDKTLEQCSVGSEREDDARLISYLSHMAAGLRYLHFSGIIHRDLTPKNVLVAHGIAKLCDFGVAKFVRRGTPYERMADAAASTRCPGTLLFMPPEALRNPAVYGKPLDIFSSGAVVLSVLTGFAPSENLLYSSRTRTIVLADGGEQEETIPERERRRDDLNRLPDDHPLKPLIVRCLANEPAHRPTADELHDEIKEIADIEAHVKSEPVTSGSQTASGRHQAALAESEFSQPTNEDGSQSQAEQSNQTTPVRWRMPGSELLSRLGPLHVYAPLCLLVLVTSALLTVTWSPEAIDTLPTAPTSLASPPALRCPVDTRGSGGCCIFLDDQLVFASTVDTKLQSPTRDDCTLTHRVRLEPKDTKTVVVNIQPSRDIVCAGHMKYKQSLCRMPPRSLLKRTLTPDDGNAISYNHSFALSAEEDAGSIVCAGFERQGMTTGDQLICFLVDVIEPSDIPIATMDSSSSSSSSSATQSTSHGRSRTVGQRIITYSFVMLVFTLFVAAFGLCLCCCLDLVFIKNVFVSFWRKQS